MVGPCAVTMHMRTPRSCRLCSVRREASPPRTVSVPIVAARLDREPVEVARKGEGCWPDWEWGGRAEEEEEESGGLDAEEEEEDNGGSGVMAV